MRITLAYCEHLKITDISLFTFDSGAYVIKLLLPLLITYSACQCHTIAPYSNICELDQELAIEENA